MDKSMFFEFSVSPAKKPKIMPVIEEKELLILGPFKPVPKLEFNDVKVSTISTKAIAVYNPSKCPIKVNFEVSDGAEELKLDPHELEVGGGETVDVNVVWLAPSVPANFRYTVNTKSATHKKLPHIIVVCHSKGPKIVPGKKKKTQSVKKTLKVVKMVDDIDRRLTYDVKDEKPRTALQNVHNTLDALNKTYMVENGFFVGRGSENLPPLPTINVIGSTPPSSSATREKMSLTVVRKRKSSHDESKFNKQLGQNCASENDPLTSTPNKVESPKFRDSLESCSFDTISTIDYSIVEETYNIDKDVKQLPYFDSFKHPMSKTFDKICDYPTPSKFNISKSTNDIDKIGDSADEFDRDVCTPLSFRPFNDRSTFTVSSSRMAQSMNDIASYFKQSNEVLTDHCSKSTCNLTDSDKLQRSTFPEAKTMRLDIDRSTFVIPFPKKVHKNKNNIISASMDRLENSNTSTNVRPRSFSTSVTYLDSENMSHFMDYSSLNDSKFKKAATVYSAFFHEPENIPVNEDPFSRKNMEFHTEEWLNEREYELLNWLNALMTPPSGWEGISQITIESEDIAKMWHAAARAKTLLLPPSKESLATQSLLESGRLNKLRKAASQLFNSQEVRIVHDWLRAQISKKTFEVKNDVDLGKNQGSKVLIVQMLCRYNLLWLRIGLEAIYKTAIHLQSINDFQGIVIFLQRNLLHNESVGKKIASQKNYKVKMESYRAEMNAYVIEKFLLLIFFLDKAKSRRLIPFDPCLFMKNSPIKASEELLDEFIREFMKCSGGMKNNMKRIGYILTYQQTCLDEYDYSVKSRLDLRDGVRLARAVGIILKRNDWGKLLRAPAVSLLQKVNNVQVTLNTLKSEGFSIIGDITAKDIALGHREKMLSLLWQILNKFIKTRYEFSAKKIQVWWKKKTLFVAINRRIRMKEEERKTRAAIIIQSYWKGRTVRKWFLSYKLVLKEQMEARQQMLLKLNHSASIIQKTYRQHRLMKKCKEYLTSVKRSSVIIQRWYRSQKLTRQTKNNFILLKSSAIKIQRWFRSTRETGTERKIFLLKQASALIIQKNFRSWLCMKKCRNDYLKLKTCVVNIQHLFRANLEMKSCRENFLLQRNAAIKIQKHYRACREMMVIREEFLNLRKSAVKIQTWYRACSLMKADRKSYLNLKRSVLIIERRYADYMVMTQYRTNYLIKKEATVKIQVWYRGLKKMKYEREQYLLVKKSAIIIQQRFRGYLLTKKLKSEYLLARSSACKIQNWFRACQSMKSQREKFMLYKEAAIIIQRSYRNYCQMKICRSKYLLLKSSAIKIQNWYRSCCQMKHDRNQFLIMQQSAVKIQHFFCGYLQMKDLNSKYLTLKASAVLIQRWYRACTLMKQERKEFLLQKTSAEIIQKNFRSYLLMKKYKSDYLILRSSAIQIQTWYRACKLMKRDRQQFIIFKYSALVIQHKFRSYLLMRNYRSDYLKMKSSVVKIQNWYRACKLMKDERQNFLRMRQSTKVIQNRFRNYILMKNMRCNYLKIRLSTVKIQKWYRASKLMKIERKKFLLIKQSTETIQIWFKNYLLMKECRCNYIDVKTSCIKIQNWYRACRLMQIERNKFNLAKRSAEIIQHRFRSYLIMKQCRSYFLHIQSSVIKIQNWYRACQIRNIEKQRYLCIKHSVQLLQTKLKSYLAMKKCRLEYVKLKLSTCIIQRWYRALKQAKSDRNQYLILRKSTLLIQQRFRGLLQMRKCRKKYLCQKSSCIKIQKWFRACELMKSEREYYLKLKNSALIIQKKHRDYILMKECRSNYLKMKSAAVLIENWYRASKLMRNQREHFLQLKLSTLLIQNRFRAQRQMKLDKQQYVNKKRSAILIQTWFRGLKLMLNERSEYKKIRNSALVIQTYYKGYLLMKSCRQEFVKKQASAIIIQKWFRKKLTAIKYYREQQNLIFTNMNEQAVKIQRWYRSILIMKKERQHFLDLRMAAVVIQVSFRKYLQLKSCRNEFLLKKSSAIKIQRWFRASKSMLEERKKYLLLKDSVVKIQRYVRKYVIEKKIKEKSLEIQVKAATKIQSVWKRYKIYKKYRDTLLAMKAKSDKERDEPLLSEPLRHRYVATMLCLKHSRGSLKEKLALLRMFFKLTTYSRELSSELCVSLEFHQMLWTTLHNANRALHYFDVCDVGLNIVMNLAKANPLGLFHILRDNLYIDVLLGLMMKYLSSMPSLFCKCATIIWILTKEPVVAVAYNKNSEILKRLNRFKVLSAQSKSSRINKVNAQHLKSLPLSRIDGGYSGNFKLSQFQDNLFAIETILSELQKYSKLR